MSTMFESSFSTSVMRPPLNTADAPSMADSLPSINFGFDDLRERMNRFTAKFDNFIEQGRKRVLEERNQFRMNIAELNEEQRTKKDEIEILSLKTTTHQQTLSKEIAEKNEMREAIATLETQRDAHLTTRDDLQEQIAAIQKAIDNRVAAQRAHAQHLESQSRHNLPEIEFWQTNLGVRVEGAGVNDRLKFIFTQLDERDYNREAWFELDTSRREYGIMHCKPKLEKEKVDKVLDHVNEHRSLAPLLKGMRDLFVEAIRG